jgi:transposase InsO family protein
MPDAALVEAIRKVLIDSPFHGEGYRKVWARLRHAGLRTSTERVRRLMRENGLSATTRMGRPRGPRNHDGTIITETIDTMWGTDMTAAFTVEHGQVAVFVAVDHCSAECVGIHAALHGTRHEALEPIRQGVAERFGGVEKDAARGLAVRHDHGSQYMSRDFQREIAWLGARSSLAFIRAPEGNGCAPDAEGEPALGEDLPNRRGTPSRPDRLQANLQRMLADRAPRPPLASPVPTRPDGHDDPGRIIAIGCLKSRGRYTSSLACSGDSP